MLINCYHNVCVHVCMHEIVNFIDAAVECTIYDVWLHMHDSRIVRILKESLAYMYLLHGISLKDSKK